MSLLGKTFYLLTCILHILRSSAAFTIQNNVKKTESMLPFVFELCVSVILNF